MKLAERKVDLGYVPQERQAKLHYSDARQILYGGAAGGGKSHALRMDAVHSCLHNPGLDAYLFRRTLNQLEKNHVRQIVADVPRELGEFNRTRKVMEFFNGSQLNFCYCEHEDDVENYQGAEIHWLGIDEAGQFTPYQISYLRSRNRVGRYRPVEYTIPRCVLTANPGGVSHQFLKETFIDPSPSETVFFDPTTVDPGNPEDRGWSTIFIPARMSDNEYLDTGYAGQFNTLPDHLAKMLRDGDWDVVPDAFFSGAWSPERVIRPFRIPDHWTRFRSVDWGFATPFSVGWWAVSDGTVSNVPAGALVRYREWYGAQTDRRTGKFLNVGLRMDGDQVGREIVKRSLMVVDGKEVPEKIAYTVADPSMWRVDSGPSQAEKMARAGVPLLKADNKREAGWQEMYERMKGGMLLVFEGCRQFINTVPALQTDDKNPEDVLKAPHDHVGDEARYGCMSRPWVKGKEKKAKVKTGYEFNEIMKRVSMHRENERVRI